MWNAEQTIRETLESVVSQTYSDLEIIVVDNASTDGSVSIVRQSKDPRLRLYLNERNIGGERNFSRAVSLASGEYTAVYHADDVYLPTIVAQQVAAFRQYVDVGAVFTLAEHINYRGEVIGGTDLPPALRRRPVHGLQEILLPIMENGNFLVFPSAMLRTSLYKSLLPFDVERFGTSADLDMWLRALKWGPIAILNKRLVRYRISTGHGSYTTRYLRTEEADFFKVMDLHLATGALPFALPRSSQRRYEFLRSVDHTRRATNSIIKGEFSQARRLLRLPSESWAGALLSFGAPRLLAFWVGGRVLAVAVCLGLGKAARRPLRWFLYSWLRRRCS
jgi:glycosyltransferase involved in cell wall biosynthesis